MSVTLVVAGCGDGDGSSEPAPPGADLPYATFPSPDGDAGFDGALLEGTLRFDGSCLLIESAGGSFALAFADGDAAWNDAHQVLDIEGLTLSPGQQVSSGGGTASAETQVPACPSIQVWRVAPGSVTIG